MGAEVFQYNLPDVSLLPLGFDEVVVGSSLYLLFAYEHCNDIRAGVNKKVRHYS